MYKGGGKLSLVYRYHFLLMGMAYSESQFGGIISYISIPFLLAKKFAYLYLFTSR